MPQMTRRSFIATTASFAVAAPIAGLAQTAPAVHVLKDPNCGCCVDWVQILQSKGFAVTTEDIDRTLLIQHKLANGIPEEMISCHTGKVDGYFIEGHVPPADIRRLLSERPTALGLSVPGMPFGSPGMGPEDSREAYDVFLIRQDGSTEVFARYEAA